MPDFTHEFVSSFVPAYQRGSEQGIDAYNKAKSFRMMQAQFDLDKQLKAREAEIRESEELRRQAEHDREIAETQRQIKIAKEERQDAQDLLDVTIKLEETQAKQKAAPRAGVGDVKLRTQRTYPLKKKKEMLQRKIRSRIDPLSALPEKIGAKGQAEIGLIEQRTATSKALEVKYGRYDKQTSDKDVWNFAKEWISAVVGIHKDSLQGLSPEQYQKWVGSIAKQYRAGIRPEDMKLPQITEKTPFIDKQWPRGNIEATADTTFFPFNESEMEKRYLR